MRVVGMKYRRLRSGITRSMERGRPPEIHNRVVTHHANEQAVDAPMNARLVEMVEELADGRRVATGAVFDELLPLVRRAQA